MDVGVRAEPKFLRDPTSLEYLSSGLNWVSHYLASNIQKRQSNASLFSQQEHGPQLQNSNHGGHHHHSQEEQEQENNGTFEGITTSNDNETVTFAAFQNVHGSLLLPSSLLLLLGYQNGFQVWDVTSPENVHETCSLRDQTIGAVHSMHILKDPYSDGNDCDLVDPYAEARPLLAIISSFCSIEEDDSGENDIRGNNNNNDSVPFRRNSLSMTRKRLRIFSLNTHQMIKDFSDLSEQGINVTSVQSNSHAITLGCLDDREEASLHILSTLDFSNQGTLTDVYSHPTIKPVFTLGTRYIAYASTATNSDHASNGLLTHIVDDKDIAGAAKDIAKEVVHGVKSLSEYSYHSISNYFVQQQHPHTNGSSSPLSTTPTVALEGLTKKNSSSSITNDNNRNNRDNRETDNNDGRGVFSYFNYPIGHGTPRKGAGSIMIRDLQKLQSVCAHFQANMESHPITQLAFNSSGTLLLSATHQGHTFRVFSLVSSFSEAVVESSVIHLYSLSRGITDAQVDDVHFSTDSLWCNVSTARGTAHVYPINPYGGSTEIASHVQGRVINPKPYPRSSFFKGGGGNQSFYGRRMNSNNQRAVSLNPIVRIKQRRPVHQYEDGHSNHQKDKIGDNNNWTTTPLLNSPLSSLEHSSNYQQQHRAKLATHFLPRTKTPHLFSNNIVSSEIRGSSSWKAHISNFLTNKKFSPSSITTNNTAATKKDSSSWTSHLSYSGGRTAISGDQNDDNRMFGFDEEEQQGKDSYYHNSRSSFSTVTTIDGGHQDIYSIHPEGILTLHRCWLTETLVNKRKNGRVVEKLELNVKEGDIAEWKVARKPDWNQVRMLRKRKQYYQQQPQQPRTGWLAYAEITTYDSQFDKPLWDHRYYSHISLHTFIENETGTLAMNHDHQNDNNNNNSNDNDTDNAKMYQHSQFVPPTVPLSFTQDAPEPYESRIDRVGRTSAASKEDGALLLDDALAELEENISNAITSSFSPSLFVGFLNTESPDSPSSNSQFSSTSTGSTPSVIAVDQLSFEDACLVTVANEQQEKLYDDENNKNYNSINDDTTNDNELKVTDNSDKGEQEVCSPDGDNELASPNEEENLVMMNGDN